MDFLLNILGVIVILGIVWFLYEKGIIRNIRFPIIKYKYTFNHSATNGKLRLTYGKYNGVGNYPIRIEPGEKMEFHYDVKVEEGSLVLAFGRGKEKLFDREFFESEKGKLAFTLNKKVAAIAVTGKYTKGSCAIRVVRENEEREEA